MKSDQDWVGEWFRLHKERGEDVEMYMGYQKAPSSDPVLLKVDHCTHDGMSGFLNVLKDAGMLEQNLLPKIKKRTRLNPLLALIGAIRILFFRNSTKNQWKLSKNAQAKDQIDFAHLSLEETNQVRSYCKRSSLHLATFLLWTLDETVRSLADKDTPSTLWMLPLTMRNSVEADKLLGNAATFLDMPIHANDSPHSLQNRMKTRFFFQEHVLNYDLLRIGRWIGTNGMRKILNSKTGGNERTGVLSAMGVWGDPGHHFKDSNTFGAPPTTAFQPISATWAVWMGKMMLTIRLNRQVLKEPKFNAKLLATWREKILSVTDAQILKSAS
jgi:hypothetical protein